MRGEKPPLRTVIVLRNSDGLNKTASNIVVKAFTIGANHCRMEVRDIRKSRQLENMKLIKSRTQLSPPGQNYPRDGA